jgi:hypothetical protein
MNSVPLTTSSSSFRLERATSRARWLKSCSRLVDAGTIRVIDVLILTKNEDGTVRATRCRASRAQTCVRFAGASAWATPAFQIPAAVAER